MKQRKRQLQLFATYQSHSIISATGQFFWLQGQILKENVCLQGKPLAAFILHFSASISIQIMQILNRFVGVRIVE